MARVYCRVAAVGRREKAGTAVLQIEMMDEIKATPEQVWTLLSDAKRYPEWVAFTDRMLETPEGAMGVGSTYREYGGVPPYKSESAWRVTEFDAPRRQVHVGADKQMQSTLTLELTPAGEGTQMRQQIDLQPRGPMLPLSKIMWPLLMRGRSQRVMESTFANAKRILDVGGA